MKFFQKFKPTSNTYSIHFELTVLFVSMLLISSITLALFSFFTAKAELDRTGELILKNSVSMAREAINQKATLVKLGVQTLPRAQEDVKEFVLGPKRADGTRPINRTIDLGKNGYIFILSRYADEIAHPSIEGQNTWLTKDMSGKDFYVAQDIIDKAIHGGGFTYYAWKYPFTDQIVPKVAYAEFDPNWDWVIVSSIYMDDYNRGANRIFEVLTYTFVALVLVGILFLFWISRHISRPIQAIAASMDAVDMTRQYYPKVTLKHKNEIGTLANAFNKMSDNLAHEYAKRVETEQELIALNNDLEQRVLQRTDELFEINRKLTASEKMAALTQLVFGIAHELNTPLGNAITVGSYMENLLRALKTAIEQGAVSQEQLRTSCQDFEESIQILNRSLGTASKMVESFKQVAPKLQILELSQVHLKNLFELIILSMAEEIRSHNVTVQINCPPELAIESYPEDLLQILNQLIANSITHGFKHKHAGNIDITVTQLGDRIDIHYADDGIGIDPNQLEHLFEPFYTTSRSQGSLGLGLFVLYNTVTQKMKGDIRVLEPGKQPGFNVVLSLPEDLRKVLEH